MAEITLTQENFEQEVLKSDKPVLVDFWATWCGPCKMLAPIVAEIAEERADIKVGKVNIDEQYDLAMKYHIASIPTLMLFKGGKVVKKTVGYMSKSELITELELYNKTGGEAPSVLFFIKCFIKIKVQIVGQHQNTAGSPADGIAHPDGDQII